VLSIWKPKLLRFGLATLVLAASTSDRVGAQALIPGYPPQVTAYDRREVGRLPKYCLYTQSFRDAIPGGSNEPQISYWYSTLGEPFHAMHHYCWGLMKLNRALYLARSKQARDFYFGAAITEFDYVLERSPDNFVLRPEILTKKGQALIRLGRGPLAVPILERAIELKPDYWPPYVQLSDHYKASGQAAQARETLEKALAQSPGVETLKQKLAELDGAKGKPRESAK
jgi:tetratricopeptide (TPR) repeat protein